jgi:hypothetical protein
MYSYQQESESLTLGPVKPILSMTKESCMSPDICIQFHFFNFYEPITSFYHQHPRIQNMLYEFVQHSTKDTNQEPVFKNSKQY